MSESVRCPSCGYEFTSKPLRAWSFSRYKVKRYKCKKCAQKFNLYESSKGKFTIPKMKIKG